MDDSQKSQVSVIAGGLYLQWWLGEQRAKQGDKTGDTEIKQMKKDSSVAPLIIITEAHLHEALAAARAEGQRKSMEPCLWGRQTAAYLKLGSLR